MEVVQEKRGEVVQEKRGEVVQEVEGGGGKVDKEKNRGISEGGRE